jgi:hypothetical protein
MPANCHRGESTRDKSHLSRPRFRADVCLVDIDAPAAQGCPCRSHGRGSAGSRRSAADELNRKPSCRRPFGRAPVWGRAFCSCSPSRWPQPPEPASACKGIAHSSHREGVWASYRTPHRRASAGAEGTRSDRMQRVPILNGQTIVESPCYPAIVITFDGRSGPLTMSSGVPAAEALTVPMPRVQTPVMGCSPPPAQPPLGVR